LSNKVINKTRGARVTFYIRCTYIRRHSLRVIKSYILLRMWGPFLRIQTQKSPLQQLWRKILGNCITQRVRRMIADCGGAGRHDAVCVFSLSFSPFFSRFSETVSCTRFWVIYFYGFERGDGVEKGRKNTRLRARTHCTQRTRIAREKI